MTKQTLTYSDGTETVVNYKKPEGAEEIERVNAEMVEMNTAPEATPSVSPETPAEEAKEE